MRLRLGLLSLMVSSCAYFGPKPLVLNPRPPMGSGWSVKQVIRGDHKDGLSFFNGTQVQNIAYELKYRDAFANPSRPEEITYLYEGSPCQNCDGIRSIYLVNPKLGKAKLTFLPGNYYANDPQTDQQQLEFRGELYHGKCLESYPSGVFLYKETFMPNPENKQKFEKKLVYVGSFQENYMTKRLSIQFKDEIESQSRSKSSSCYQLAGNQKIQIPL